jgi:hypothetical protein
MKLQDKSRSKIQCEQAGTLGGKIRCVSGSPPTEELDIVNSCSHDLRQGISDPEVKS